MEGMGIGRFPGSHEVEGFEPLQVHQLTLCLSRGSKSRTQLEEQWYNASALRAVRSHPTLM